MGINLISYTEVKAGMLVADTVTSASGASDSIPPMTKVNGVTISAALEIQSTLGGFVLPRMTTAQRDALLATPGMQIYNTQTGVINLRDNTNTWTVPAGTGTVTSVDVQNTGTGISFSGGPITGSGTIHAELSTSLQSLSDLVSEGLLVKQSGALITRSLETTDSSQITISNADGVSGNPMIGLATTGIVAGSYTQADVTVGTDGRIYAIASGGGSGGAPASATYIIQTPNGFLPDAQPLSALSTGILKNTTTTGVLSIASPGTDYYSLNNPTRILDSGFAVGNFFIGSGSGNLTLTSAEFNTGVGVNALNAIDTGIQNTFMGHSAGLLLVGGRYNSGFGELSLSSLVNDDANTALGFNAGNALTGNGSTVLGANAISATTSATNCFALGRDTVMANALTNAGVIGYSATVSASNSINIGNGCKIGFGVASPAYNLDIAAISSVSAIKVADSGTTPTTPASGSVFYSNSGVPFSLSSSGTPQQYYIDGNPLYIKVGTTSGNQNSFYIGQFVNNNIASITVPRTVAIGNNALLNMTTGSSDIVAIGYRAAFSTTTPRTNIVAIGPNALLAADSSSIVCIGQNCLAQTSTAGNTVGIGTNVGPFGTCSNSVLIGDNSATAMRNILDSVVIGNLAGPTQFSASANSYQRNTAVGALSSGSSAVASGITDSTFIGYNTNSGSVNPIINSTAIGSNTQILVSNAMNFGSNCFVGLNNHSPAYNLDIANISNACATKLALGTAVPTSGESGSYTFTFTAITSGTADLALSLFTLPINKTASVEVFISGVDELLSDSTGGTGIAVVRRDAGNIVLAGTNYTKIVTSTGDFGISVDTGTQAVILNATGIVAENYYWVIEVKYIIL